MKFFSTALLAASLFVAAAASQAWTFDFAGPLNDGNDVIWGAFTLDTDYEEVKLFAVGYADSPSNPLDPFLALWSSDKLLIAANDDRTDNIRDSLIVTKTLTAGEYYFSLSRYPNLNIDDDRASGFYNDGKTYAVPGANWTLHIEGVVTASVPEPETYAMLLAGLGIIGVVARRRRRLQ